MSTSKLTPVQRADKMREFCHLCRLKFAQIRAKKKKNIHERLKLA